MKFKPIILATIVIFAAGVAAGGFWTNHLQAAGTPPQFCRMSVSENRPAGLRPPKILSQPFLHTLDKNLQLTPDQHNAIQKIMSEGQNQMRKVVQDSRLEIREALTPTERLSFDALVSRRFQRPLFSTNVTQGFNTASQ